MKSELKLAFQAGILYILSNRDVEKLLDQETKERLQSDSGEEFDKWYKSIVPLFALISNEV